MSNPDITGIIVPVEADIPAEHPHVTLLAPFRPRVRLDDELCADLEALFATVSPFAFALTKVGTFPDGTRYLAPEPAAPFRDLTETLARSYPDTPPYGGAFADVIPHVTLTDHEAPVPPLPIALHAREAQLVHAQLPEFWDVVARFPFAAP